MKAACMQRYSVSRSAKDAYFGSGALKLLGPMEKAQTGALCRVASTQMATDSVDLETAFYASHILGTAGYVGSSQPPLHSDNLMHIVVSSHCLHA